MAKKTTSTRANKNKSFRVGRVRAFMRGRVWYLYYHEHGQRHQPRVGPDRDLARQTAAEINAQLEVGMPSALGFEPISIPQLRQRWLDHHEHVRRSSVQTIRRYRSATEHLLHFLRDIRPLRRASDFRPCHAEKFVRYLRSEKVAPNGHARARKRPLRDAGIKYILDTCSTLFNYAHRNRHLSPYAENPLRVIEIGRIPVEDAKPIIIFTPDQERSFLQVCDDWQLPLFLTLLFTGLRPGEVTHLLLPNDLDLDSGWLYIRNKPNLGWQIKTRNERDIPLVSSLAEVLRLAIGNRTTGPVFRQRQCENGNTPLLAGQTSARLEQELLCRVHRLEADGDGSLTRADRLREAGTIWRDVGAIKPGTVRNEFMRITAKIELPHVKAPKTLRHTFATILQDANVDPLIRNELMGHVPAGSSTLGSGLAMTAVYTHTRPETKRHQLERALNSRPAIQDVLEWVRRNTEPHIEDTRSS